MKSIHRTPANIGLVIVTFFVTAVYALYFFFIGHITLDYSLGFSAVTILFILALRKYEEVFAEFLSDNGAEVLLVVKLMSYVITYQAIISFFTSSWVWWGLSLFLGVITILLEFSHPIFKRHN